MYCKKTWDFYISYLLLVFSMCTLFLDFSGVIVVRHVGILFLFFADFGSQDCYDIPRSFPSEKSCSFDFNENFNSYFVSAALIVLLVFKIFVENGL